jgi:hypothetical protein
MVQKNWLSKLARAALCGFLALSLGIPGMAGAHCDTMDGPVVVAARAALDKGEATPVLKWVKKEDEAEVRDAFKQALAVRTKGKEAKEMADRCFFETVVRLHRAGEGEPYTGLKPAGTDSGPIVKAADQALESGSVKVLVKNLTDQIAAGVRERFQIAAEKQKRAEESVEAGRAYVTAYVEFMHYAEKLYHDALGHGPHQGPASGPKTEGCQHH